ncbi:MAG: C_GCAxxG_C_C family protein [Spirochaetes bacterium]|nr:C_GCAxxG_C_C family protein [Spirochaetota bacterium]
MVQDLAINNKIKELENRVWNNQEITKRFEKLAASGIIRKNLDKKALMAEKDIILDRVQLRAEENNYYAKNCAQGTAIALLEEFGVGSLEIIKALSPFPGIGGTGEICGAITGSLIAFGLLFGSENIADYEAKGRTIGIAQQFIGRFREKFGHIRCADIQEKVIFGRDMAPGSSEENMAAFAEARGFEKCGLAPGFGARMAAGLIIDNL